MATEQLGFVVIGRNEGPNLVDALKSLPADVEAVVYVDSGSTDDSIEIATSTAVMVHELDPSEPFSAARARKEGVEKLLERHPELQMIQFLDGDCVLEPGWIQAAADFLGDNPSVGVVCGMLRERYPEASIYNRFNASRWRSLPLGDIAGSGGIFLARREAYESAGGFRSELLTGEELDFCNRVREAGYRIARIPVPMADHDSQLLHFSEWWSRAVWGGRGDALQLDVLGEASCARLRREVRSVVTWVLVVPSVVLAGAILSLCDARFLLVVAMALAAYAVLAARIMAGQVRRGDGWGEAFNYSMLAVLRKLPYSLGFLEERRR
ncbi:glycosyltransferase [Thioalkalivibrio sp. XN8]|uniref:glycosyltransferase n=1 Tax=Thioalkalivibrio sp. XN8 TaxID=2712863 RepID=UPI0013E9C1A7|nr:glycosyltransferase family 2 protein [Thioalkalivibrio sp. XN8]